MKLLAAQSASAAGQLVRVKPDHDDSDKLLQDADNALGEPFASKAQQKWAFANKMPFAKKWADITNFKHLPEKVKLKKKKSASEETTEAVDYSPTTVPGPYDAKTQSKDTLSSRTSHDTYGGTAKTSTIPSKHKNQESQQNLRETLTFYPMLIEGSYDPETRTADVLIIEEGLGNRRDKHYYGTDTLLTAVAQGVFEGAQAYADHPSRTEESDRPERSVRDLIGYYYDVRSTKSAANKAAICAKLKIQEGQDWAFGLIREAIDYAKRFPGKVYAGLSINADGDVSPAEVGGQQVNYVHSITDVFSADLVTRPARGGKFLTLVENARGAQGDTMKATVLEAARRLQAEVAKGEKGEVDPGDLAIVLSHVKESAGSDDGVTNAQESKGGNAVSDNAGLKSVGGVKHGVDADNDADDEADVKEARSKADKASADLIAKAKESNVKPDELQAVAKLHESAVKNLETVRAAAIARIAAAKANIPDVQRFSSLYEAARIEAQTSLASNTKQTIDTLRKDLAEAKARIAFKESVELVKGKLIASDLPEAWASRLMPQLIGKTAQEMDSLIETETKALAELGVSKKTIGGNRERTHFTEASAGELTGALLSGLGD